MAFSQSLTEGVCVLGGTEGLKEVDTQAAQGGQVSSSDQAVAVAISLHLK